VWLGMGWGWVCLRRDAARVELGRKPTLGVILMVLWMYGGAVRDLIKHGGMDKVVYDVASMI